MKRLVLAVCAVSLFGGVSFAKEIKHSVSAAPVRVQSDAKTGFGFNSQLSGNTTVDVNGQPQPIPATTSLALRYWTAGSMGFEGILGFGFGDNAKGFDLGGKVLGVIKKESNMRVYGYGIIGIENVSIKVQGKDYSDTAFTIGTGVGAEFFLSNLPNLGFGVEAGIGYNSSSKLFGTQAGLTNVGVRYYFS